MLKENRRKGGKKSIEGRSWWRTQNKSNYQKKTSPFYYSTVNFPFRFASSRSAKACRNGNPIKSLPMDAKVFVAIRLDNLKFSAAFLRDSNSSRLRGSPLPRYPSSTSCLASSLSCHFHHEYLVGISRKCLTLPRDSTYPER